MKKNLIIILLVLFLSLMTGCSENGKDTDENELNVYCFKAGSADSFLLTTKESAVLIDTGEAGFGKEIVDYLNQNGISEIDCMIITHFDQDHVGGAKKVLSEIPVKRIITNDQIKENKESEKFLSAVQSHGYLREIPDDTIRFLIDGVDYQIVPAAKYYTKDTSNNSSLIVQVSFQKRTLLFLGDIQDERIRDILSALPSNIDVLKVPYHGRKLLYTQDLISALRPKIAVITSSEQEKEDLETLSLYHESCDDVFLTRNDPVLMTVTKNRISAKYVSSD